MSKSIQVETHRPMETMEKIDYTPGLALEIAFAVERLMVAEAAYEQEQTCKTEAEQYHASMALVKPQWYAALLTHIDRLESQRERLRVAKQARREAV